jgi:isopenicillin N synthase-like dioxygenase
VAERHIEAMVSLGTSVSAAIALALDVPEEIFTSRIDKAFWNLRILAYEGTDTNSSSGEAKTAGMYEHTGTKSFWSHVAILIRIDFGILTFLLTDSQKDSLQVLLRTGEWISADPIPVSCPQTMDSESNTD